MTALFAAALLAGTAFARPPSPLLAPLPPAPLAFLLDPTLGNYTIMGKDLNNPLFTSAPTYFRANGKLYSTSDGSLALSSPPSSPVPGTDALGDFTRVQLTWATPHDPPAPPVTPTDAATEAKRGGAPPLPGSVSQPPFSGFGERGAACASG